MKDTYNWSADRIDFEKIWIVTSHMKPTLQKINFWPFVSDTVYMWNMAPHGSWSSAKWSCIHEYVEWEIALKTFIHTLSTLVVVSELISCQGVCVVFPHNPKINIWLTPNNPSIWVWELMGSWDGTTCLGCVLVLTNKYYIIILYDDILN